ncbi:MgtC/SapB family protein, partial [Escherichia coli]|nr:MgtC/SapB family protein [Escherichia coli]
MTAEFIIRLILAAIACGAIGMERQMRGKGAGLRTHVLIGMGSALFMIVSKYGFAGNDSNLLIVFYVQIMPDDFVMQ